MPQSTLSDGQKKEIATLFHSITSQLSEADAQTLIKDKDRLCALYRTLEPEINLLLPLLEHLPHGGDIVKIIQFLEQLGDMACPLPKPVTP